MKLTVPQEKLNESVSLVSKAVSPRSLNLILTHIRLQVTKKKATLTGSDGDFTIEHTIEVESKKDGSVLIPARLFGELVSRLPHSQKVDLEVKDGVLKVTSGFSDYDIRVLPDENFPALPIFEDEKLTDVSCARFKDALNKTSFCALKDPTGTTSHYTQGVLINFQEENLDIVGTDGHRLAFIQLDNPSPEIKDKSLLVPTVIIDELRRALPAEDTPLGVFYKENQVFFRFESTVFVGSLFDIRFPDYKRVIPKETKSLLNVNRTSLRDALQRVMTVFRVREQNPVVRLETKEQMLLILSESPDIGKGVEEVPFSRGEPFVDSRIALNPAYLADVLSVLSSENVDLHWISEVNPLKLAVPEDPSFIYIVMPIRMD